MKIVGFGDYLIHFSPFGNERFLQADLMTTTYTGAEANVCAALAFWNEDVSFITRLPEHHLATKGVMFLKSFGIHTDSIAYGSGRMGLYFLEKGHDLRPSAVIYDRSETVFTKSCFSDYDWAHILDHADAFYLSGITPSLSDSLLDCCEQVLRLAKDKNIPVFFDVNLRPTLCSLVKSREIFAALSPYITHLISNEEHLKQLLDYAPSTDEVQPRLEELSHKAREATGIANIAITVRRTINAHQTAVYASYFSGSTMAVSQKYEIDVVDRVGSGDAFSAGIVYSVLHSFDHADTVNFAMASGALKHTVNSDINYATLPEIRNLMASKGFDVVR